MGKEREYIFDSFRGFLIWSMVFFHFLRIGGQFAKGSLSGVIYICVCIYIMEAFMFLSGYFSKKPDRAKETAFKTFMLPYIVFIILSYLFRDWYFGNAKLDFLTPPFALWFLFVAFFYRYFLKELLRVKHLFAWSVFFFLIAGQIEYFGRFLGLGRAISYFPFFLLGYYCRKEHLDKIRSLKKWQVLILGCGLVGISCVLAFVVDVPVGWYMLRDPGSTYGVVWWQDILLRIMVPFVSIGWIIFIFNIVPAKKTYLSYIGTNTMTVYVLHIFIRYVLKANGVHMPNQPLYVGLMLLFSILCVVILSSPPIAKAYDKLFDQLYALYVKLKKFLLIYPPEQK